jgi:hypothetical protein
MIIASLQRWNWLLIAVVVGLALGYANRLTPDDFPSYGAALNSQRQFEAALVEQIGDVPRFKDLTVQRCHVAGLGAMDFVSGLYCTGVPEQRDNAYHWKPTFFVAPVPYRRLSDGGQQTVRDLLADQNVRYTNAWWRSRPMATWLTASILFIGLIWPTLVTRMYFGRWTRPAEAKGMSLWRVKPSRAVAPPAPQSPFTPMHEPMEAPPAPAAVSSEAVLAAPTVPLANTPLAPAAPVTADQKEFGAKPDDFYPTAVKLRRSGRMP